MSRIYHILNSFEKLAEDLPPVEPSDRVKTILEKAAICPQLMGIGMDEIQVMDKDELPGGLADDKVPESEEEAEAIEDGQAVEMEHTDDGDKAKEIAEDHVEETTPEYYDNLEEMEGKLEVEKEKGLADPSVEDKEIIMRFLQTQDDLDDETLHKLYMALGVDPEEGEEVVYAAAADQMGDDPGAPKDIAQTVEEKEVEREDEPEADESSMTEEQQTKERLKEKEASDKSELTFTLDEFTEFLNKKAEAPPVAERKGTDNEDNQKDEEVPTQITDNSPKNVPPKGVSAKADETAERKKAEDEQSGEKNEKVAALIPPAKKPKKKPQVAATNLPPKQVDDEQRGKSGGVVVGKEKAPTRTKVAADTPPSCGPKMSGSKIPVSELGVKFNKEKAKGSSPAHGKKTEPESSPTGPPTPKNAAEKLQHIGSLSDKLLGLLTQ